MMPVTDIDSGRRYHRRMKNHPDEYPVTLQDLRGDLLVDIARCRALTGADAVAIEPMLKDLRQLVEMIDEALAAVKDRAG